MAQLIHYAGVPALTVQRATYCFHSKDAARSFAGEARRRGLICNYDGCLAAHAAEALHVEVQSRGVVSFDIRITLAR